MTAFSDGHIAAVKGEIALIDSQGEAIRATSSPDQLPLLLNRQPCFAGGFGLVAFADDARDGGELVAARSG